MGEITVLNARGDERIEWDPNDKEQVATAKKKFKELKDEGYNFYEVAESRGKQITRFSAKAGKLLAAPGARSAADKQTGRRQAAMAGGPVTERA